MSEVPPIMHVSRSADGLRFSGFDFSFMLGLRISGLGFEFRISGFGFRVSSFGFRILGFGCTLMPKQ